MIRHNGQNGAVLLIDAANVVGSRPTGWWRDRAGAARTFVDQVRAAVESGQLPNLSSWSWKAGLAGASLMAPSAVSGSCTLRAAVTTRSLMSPHTPLIKRSHSSRRIANYGGGLSPWEPT